MVDSENEEVAKNLWRHTRIFVDDSGFPWLLDNTVNAAHCEHVLVPTSHLYDLLRQWCALFDDQSLCGVIGDYLRDNGDAIVGASPDPDGAAAALGRLICMMDRNHHRSREVSA